MTEKQKIQVQSCILDCKMIQVERADVDPDINYTGFPVWLSDSFLLMTNVYDFHDEGYVLLRTSDISEIAAKDADFYAKICIQEGLREKASACTIQKADSYFDVLNQFLQYPGYLSVHCENEEELPQYLLGRIVSPEETGVKFASLGCDGKWDTELDFIPYDRITMLAWDDYYAKMYYRYCK